ncbi:hypothetical protein S2M10_29320 [Sphingomonas sp. S2M10]|uniref:hypothetical protein n=1 Tax=Sphingomonas sp. S2M10 TaxID=2705010 RepID=UPI0014574F15|nr:hypothetical protein [Sphingomonas sp. S2M10]NLS27930.1 hypothetical protein [Sphingomonas sp. S2M10]
MINVAPFNPHDLGAMVPQPAQVELAHLSADQRVAFGAGLAARGQCFTIREWAEGPVLFCGGVAEVHARYASLWSVFDQDAGRHLLAIERRTVRFLRMLHYRRIDTLVRAEFEAGHRWVLRLGFELEGHVLQDYFEDGGAACLYRMRPAR